MARTTTGRNHYTAQLLSALALAPLFAPVAGLGPTQLATHPIEALAFEIRPSTTLTATRIETPALTAALEPSVDWGNTRVRVNVGVSNVGLNWLFRF